MKRKSVPKSVETEVLTKSRRRCCLCYGLKRDDSEKAGQIAHLDGNASNNDIQNLAFLCLEHHDKYDGSTSQSKGYTIQEVKNYRRQLYDYTNSIIGKEEIEQSLKTEAQNLSRDRYPLYVLLPLDLKVALRRFLPDYRLPDEGDLCGDWLEEFDHKTLFPIVCKGKFTGSGSEDYCFFAIPETGEGYKLLVLTEDMNGNPFIIEVRSGDESPSRYYVKTVKPGDYPVSPIIWKHDGPKTLKIKNESIEVGMFGSAACIFYWSEQEGKFIEQWIAD
ncbi:MAG: hypothetical protein MUP22_11485 [Desulfobacterales bacterium]|nr:hypothetical protein [Desulfobacterales bacterium]